MRPLLILLCCVAAASADSAAQWQALHDRGAAGDKAAVESLINLLERTLAEEPGQQLVRVYLGSAYTLRSRDLGWGPSKLKFLLEGGRLMDEAVAADPKNTHVRLVRAINSYELPAFLNRRKVAREDFAILLAVIDRDRDSISREVRQAILYYAGRVEADEGKKDRSLWLWQRALAESPDSALAPDIRNSLHSATSNG